MTNVDKVIVSKGIKRQYFPNDQGIFNVKDLKRRKKGIRDIETQYKERIKTASVNHRNGQTLAVSQIMTGSGLTAGNASN